MDYKQAGVDIEKGDLFVERIQKFIHETYDDRVISGVGGFAAIYQVDDERLLATGTDGVGTKVKIAQELNIHDSIGQDLVAMCVNDVLCTGARPLFFLDYLATGKLDLDVNTTLVRGIVNACKMSQCALVGGETAEMPDVYAQGVYDLAGFCVGEVMKKDWLNGSQAGADQWLVGIKSSGFHSNGFSLVRKLIKKDETELKKQALTPTRIYVKLIQAMLKEQRFNVTGLAHITGGGIENIPRIEEKLGYELTALPGNDDRPKWMNEIISRTSMSQEDLFKTFNMGIGFVILVKDKELALSFLKKSGESPIVLGKTKSSFSGIRVTTKS